MLRASQRSSKVKRAFPEASLTAKKEKHVSVVTSLITEFSLLFQVFSCLEKEISLFSTPFQVDAEEVEESLPLELTEMQCEDSPKNQHQLLSLPTIYRGLEKKSFPRWDAMQKEWSVASAPHMYVSKPFHS